MEGSNLGKTERKILEKRPFFRVDTVPCRRLRPGWGNTEWMDHTARLVAKEGSPMSLVEFKKSHVPCHYFSYFHVDFKMGPCRMSILRNSLCHVIYNSSPVDRPRVACPFQEMAVSPCLIYVHELTEESVPL